MGQLELTSNVVYSNFTTKWTYLMEKQATTKESPAVIISPVVFAAVLQYLLFSGYMVGLQAHMYAHGEITFYENLKAIYYLVSFVSPFFAPYLLKKISLRPLMLGMISMTVLSFFMILFTGKGSYLYVYSFIQGFARATFLFLSIYVINHFATKEKGPEYMSYLTSLFSLVVIIGSWVIAHVSTSSPRIFYGGLILGLCFLAYTFLLPKNIMLHENKEHDIKKEDYFYTLRKNYVFFAICALVFMNWSIGESFITMWGKSIGIDKLHADELTSYFYAGGVLLTYLLMKLFRFITKKKPMLYVGMFSLSLFICLCIVFLQSANPLDVRLVTIAAFLLGGAVVSQITIISNGIQHFIQHNHVKQATIVFVALQHCMGILTTYFIGGEIKAYKNIGFDLSVFSINLIILIVTVFLQNKRKKSGRIF